MSNLLKKIHNIGIVPVIALENVEDAAPLAKALSNGGLPVAEVTYRTDAAHDSMIEMRKACPNMVIGAGTVITKDQVDSAIEAGAEFIVSPGLNPEIVKYCQEKDIPIIPGVANASDIEVAISLGLELVKFFPAEPLGGLKMISALSAPYSSIKFMPTGGINAKNINDYLANPKIIACGGTWMIDKKAIANKDFDKIEKLTKEAVNNMLNINIKHVGINSENSKEIADAYGKLLQKDVKEAPKSYFAGNLIEVMKPEYNKGTKGHIAIGVDNCDRAKRYFEELGYEFDESTIKYDDKGRMNFIYFKDEIGDFAIHLANN